MTCPLCGKVMHRKQAQNMHFIKRSILKYRRDEKNCHAGCVRCNVILHGNYIIYTRRMQRKYGELLVDQMINDKQIVKIATSLLQEQIDHYTQLVKELKAQKGL
ncbi:MAG: recombination protein NinG [bacterium]|nr:recombination protein NinG [bacterium]